MPEGELVLCPLVHLGGFRCAVLKGGDGGAFGSVGGLTFLCDLGAELFVDECGLFVCRLLVGGGTCCELCGLLVALSLKTRLLCGMHFGAVTLRLGVGGGLGGGRGGGCGRRGGCRCDGLCASGS